MNIKNPEIKHILENIFGTFVGMIIAITWTDFFKSILKLIEEKFTFLGIIGYLLYAIIVAILAIFLILTFIKIIQTNNKNENKD